MFTTKPTPHESCSFRGSYRPCLITSCIGTNFLGETLCRLGAQGATWPFCPVGQKMAMILPQRSVSICDGARKGAKRRGRDVRFPPYALPCQTACPTRWADKAGRQNGRNKP